MATDLLVMTATPIPRTLVLTLFGDMDVSLIREKPAGRKPIDTLAKPAEQMPEILAAIGRALAGGARVYWICPLVEESEALDLVAAEERFAELQGAFGDKVGLLHGQMKGPERDAAMEAFAQGQTPVLVATTVIEVGVDVPEANIMVIEHAERFGLAQLHQLRGRVGRGDSRSVCILVYKGPLGTTAKARIETMRATRRRLQDRRGGPAPKGRRRGDRHPPIGPADIPDRAAGAPFQAARRGPNRSGRYRGRKSRL